jgi:DNA-binding transcriptional ArsR family regulator
VERITSLGWVELWENAENPDVILEAVLKPERSKIIQALFEGPQPLKALKAHIGKGYSDLLHHIRVLEAAGIVEVIRLRPRLTMAYLKREVEIRFQTGKKTIVRLREREPPVESDLMKAYWKLLLKP